MINVEGDVVAEHVPGRLTANPTSPSATGVMNLIVTAETHEDRVVPLSRPVTTVGRHADRDVVLVDRKVSSHHAEIRRTPVGLYTLHDCGSTNGTFLNGQPVTQSVL